MDINHANLFEPQDEIMLKISEYNSLQAFYTKDVDKYFRFDDDDRTATLI